MSRGRRAILVGTLSALALLLLAGLAMRDYLRQQVEKEYVQLETTAHLTATWLLANLEAARYAEHPTASLDIARGQAWLEQLGPPAPLSVAIFRDDGVLLARVPAVPDHVGHRLSHPVTDAFLAGDAPLHRFRTQSPLDGRDGHFVIQRVQGEPAVIVVGAPVALLLPALRRRVSVVGAILALVLVLGGMLLRHYLNALRLDLAIREANAQLLRTQERFHTLLTDATGMAVQGLRPDGTLFFWNDAATRLFGHTPDDVLGTETTALVPEPEQRAEVRRLLRALLEDDVMASPVRELSVRHADGHAVPVLTHHVVFRPEKGDAEIYRFDMDLSRLKELEEQLRQQATTDELTNLWNRRYFTRRARREVALAQRKKRPLAVLMIDLDHFKDVNDAHGHAMGDAVLVEVSTRLRQELRETDMLARLGGEEFVALLPETDPDTAAAVAERLRHAIAAAPLDVEADPALRITVSIGVASMRGPDDALDGMLRRADRALYRAKDTGRNRVCHDEASATGVLGVDPASTEKP